MKSSSLFRQQAIDEQKSRLFGNVIIGQPISFTLITIALLVIISSISILLIYGTYARHEGVVGYLVPDKGLVKIYAPIQGVLSRRHIQEGQQVKKNDLLFTISTIQTNAQGSDRDALLLQELEQQKLNYITKLQQEELLNERRTETLEKQIIGIKREVSQIEIAIVLQKKQLQLSSARISKLKGLFDKGHIAESNYRDGQQSYLDNGVSLQLSNRQKIQLENRHADLIQQQKQHPLEWQSRLTDLNKTLSDIEQRIVEISGRRSYTISAPVSGRLTALQISEGQTLNTQSPLIAILPEGTVLQAELFLPTRAAGFIKAGQNVFLRYVAFPYQHYGLHKGNVRDIAEIILTPNELPIPIALKEPVYRVRVDIESQTVAAYGKEWQLQAGMLLDADIVLEQRTLGQWLLEPIYGLTGH